MSKLKHMPVEIKLLILSFLRDKESLGRVAQISKEWNVLAKQNMLWSPFLFKRKIIEDAKESYRKAQQFSKLKVLYYLCTSNRYHIIHNYQVPHDFNLSKREKILQKVQFYCPRAIGYGTHIGAHADMIRLLNTVDCIVVNVLQDGHQRFSHHLTQLLKIGDVEARNIYRLEAPKLIAGFPSVPIVVVTDPAHIGTIRSQSKSSSIRVSDIVSGNLRSYHSFNSDSEREEIRSVWLNVQEAVLSSINRNNQEIISDELTCKCSIQ